MNQENSRSRQFSSVPMAEEVSNDQRTDISDAVKERFNKQIERAARRPHVKPLVADARVLAKLLGVGVRSIRTWDAAGKLPKPVKLGARVVWSIEEIREWLRAGAPDRDDWQQIKSKRSRSRL